MWDLYSLEFVPCVQFSREGTFQKWSEKYKSPCGQCFRKLTVDFKGDGVCCGKLIHNEIKLPFFFKAKKDTLSKSLWIFPFDYSDRLLSLEFGISLPAKGVVLAAEGKQEMTWKLIKLEENSFYVSDPILQSPQLPQDTETGNLATERDKFFLVLEQLCKG